MCVAPMVCSSSCARPLAAKATVRPGLMHAVQAALGGSLVALCAPAGAAGGTGAYELDWPHSHQVLTYHSCGCADDCWVVEVSDRQSGIFRGRLRCDCSTLYFYKPSPKPESRVLGSCAPINAAQSKPAAIAEKLRQLLPVD